MFATSPAKTAAVHTSRDLVLCEHVACCVVDGDDESDVVVDADGAFDDDVAAGAGACDVVSVVAADDGCAAQ